MGWDHRTGVLTGFVHENCSLNVHLLSNNSFFVFFCVLSTVAEGLPWENETPEVGKSN
jgi:hypothetical protein